ncbi:dockerin type I repeat-containing protein [Ruminococcus albus]|uniref:Dockerin domain-containing protein n=1 Tax=Ruminococcus albus TaxID=1264 RepID=A0A1I1JB60_RUMAL|nr:dockerin type I repeat-containing protein [Ruminococcus albus]SFC45351.1 hypothetical protein SAMN02910406_01733 [Ruminococcus albus]
MKLKMIAAFSAAAMMLFTSVTASADNIKRTIVTGVRLNKPYININMQTSNGTDISNVKFALKNSKGVKIATFTGKNGKVNILDGTAVDLTGIHDVDSYKKISGYESRFLDPYYTGADYKGYYPSGCTEINGDRYYYKGDDALKIAPDDEVFLTYNDKSCFKIVDTMTVPANKIVFDVDKKFLQNENKTDNCYFVPKEKGQKCEITKDNSFLMYDHAGKREMISASKGKYAIVFSGCSGSERCDVSDHAVSYSKVRIKFNEAFPGLADNNLKITKDYSEYTVTYDLRGKMSTVLDDSLSYAVVSTLCYSGSVLTSCVPDSEGYVEFWVSDETLSTDMTYTFNYFKMVDGSARFGAGGGSVIKADLPKTREKISVLMEFPQSGYCIAALKPDKYTIVMEDNTDVRDYDISGESFTVTDTKKLQTANVKISKKSLLLGDCDRNGVINVNDVTVLAAHVRGIRVLKGRSLIAADVNGSNSINVADISALAAHVKNKRLLPNKTV